MGIIKVAAAVGLACGLVSVLFEMRCWFGWHPVDGRRMRPGTRKRKDVYLTSQWECGRCNATLKDATRIRINPALMAQLRRQAPGSQERSKVIHLVVVQKKTDDEKIA